MRLTRGSDLMTCWDAGRRRRTAHLDLAWRHNESGHARTGIIVPKYQSSAIERNRLRRRLKEIIRRELLRRLPAIDLVIRAKRSAYAASFAVLRAELTDATGTLT